MLTYQLSTSSPNLIVLVYHLKYHQTDETRNGQKVMKSINSKKYNVKTRVKKKNVYHQY